MKKYIDANYCPECGDVLVELSNVKYFCPFCDKFFDEDGDELEDEEDVDMMDDIPWHCDD